MEKIKKIRPQDMAMEQIQWYIQENQLKPHTQLPSERELCTMWQRLWNLCGTSEIS